MAEAERTWRGLATADDNRAAALELARNARRQLAIFSYDLEPQVFDQPEFLQAVRDLAIGGRMSGVRILLVDSARAIREGNRLIEIARRLPSSVEIRKPHKDYLDMSEAFIVSDERGVLARRLATRWEGIADPDDAFKAREKLKLFDEIWQRSSSDVETRQLRI